MNRTWDFWLRRLHSATGVVPLGFFLLEHIFSVSRAIAGPTAFDRVVAFLESIPYVVLVEILFIGIPLAFHGLFGLWIAYGAKHNVLAYRYYRNWLFYLQRITAIVTLAFVVWHVWTLRIGKALYGTDVTFGRMAELLADPVTFALYAIGFVAAIFHFTNGLWTFMVTWGVTIGPRAQKAALCACSFLFVTLNVIGLRALVAFIM